MTIKFVVNDYVLIWNLLFQASISDTIYKLKQKIWDTYKEEYNAVFQDKNEIMKDYKNFIPDDDTIYNILFENKDYEKLKKQVEKQRIEMMKVWDKNKKESDSLYQDILRKKIPDHVIFIVNKEFNMIDYQMDHIIIFGKEYDKREPLQLLLDIHLKILKHHVKKYKEPYDKFKKAILELAVLNEYATRITGRSCYQSGSPYLLPLKRWLYPYWLMYLGVPKEEFQTYMMRDKIVFDESQYAYETELKKMNMEEFIDFCIRNQRYIVREKKEEKAIEELV